MIVKPVSTCPADAGPVAQRAHLLLLIGASEECEESVTGESTERAEAWEVLGVPEEIRA